MHDIAALFGTHLADPILAALMWERINRPHIWAQAIRSEPLKHLAGRGPSTYGFPLPAFAGTSFAGMTEEKAAAPYEIGNWD